MKDSLSLFACCVGHEIETGAMAQGSSCDTAAMIHSVYEVIRAIKASRRRRAAKRRATRIEASLNSARLPKVGEHAVTSRRNRDSDPAPLSIRPALDTKPGGTESGTLADAGPCDTGRPAIGAM
jgi:hypothetical protein